MLGRSDIKCAFCVIGVLILTWCTWPTQSRRVVGPHMLLSAQDPSPFRPGSPRYPMPATPPDGWRCFPGFFQYFSRNCFHMFSPTVFAFAFCFGFCWECKGRGRSAKASVMERKGGKLFALASAGSAFQALGAAERDRKGGNRKGIPLTIRTSLRLSLGFTGFGFLCHILL